MKMLMFDFRESEKEFFANNEFKDIDITFIKEPLNENTELSEEIYRDTDVISVFITSVISQETIEKFKNLRVVATRSTGYNHIDVHYCTQKNIAVFNVEEYGQTSVAQYTFALILSLVRNLFPAFFDVQRGQINHACYEGRNLDSLTLGIIGCGAIGSAVAKIANFFNMKVIICSYAKREDVSSFAEYVSLDEVLEKSDIITLHMPYTKDDYHFLGKEEFKKMKDGVILVNTARGELIDIVTLYENLLNGKLKGVALDVLECEYLTISNDDLADIKEIDPKCVTSALLTTKLINMNNVIITPHIAYNTQESINTLLRTTFNNIRDYSKGMHNNQIC